MAAGLLVPVVAFWKEWGTLALVLISFGLQVILLISAEIRRRKDCGVVKVVVWLAYLLADTTAIYVLGHMAVTSTTSQGHQLTAFWAPFLLLHLGGQDNITAYSIEDNRLWLRHLQSFVIQVLAAAYVLDQSSIMAHRTWLRPASILMFVVGVVKYGERVCALKHAYGGCNLFGKNYPSCSSKVIKPTPAGENHAISAGKYAKAFVAHALLPISMDRLQGPSPFKFISHLPPREWEDMYEVAEMQLSLMHDVLYTKTDLIHTWYGYGIRVVSLPATVAALLLFSLFSEKDGYRRADVSTTYVLLAGAVVLEMTTMLKATCSTWTYYKLVMVSSHCVAHALARLAFWSSEVARNAMGRATAKYWSGSMGQHNIIYMCSRCKDSRVSKIARWMGREDRWNMLFYTSFLPVTPDLSQLLKKQIKESKKVDKVKENPYHIHNSRGRAAMKLYDELSWSVDTDGLEMDNRILVWHIATHVYLNWYETEHKDRPHPLAQVTQKLSNYMMFLLAARPYMLPDNASRHRYVELCYSVIKQKYSSEKDLVRLIREKGKVSEQPADTLGKASEQPAHTFSRACHLAATLINKELETPPADMLEVISQVWVELLCYVAYRCSPESHARQLSNGGEFTAIVALMLKYIDSGVLSFNTEGEKRQDISAVSLAGSTNARGTENV